ncbi:MAG: long-chain acyl-CoA synthetase [Cellvibrionaceae bacterium]|jgi:long-chain acyl-CoA synthetase
MKRFWLDSYPKNTADDINIDDFASVPDVLAQACKNYPDSIAYSNFGTTMTFAEVNASSLQFADFLQNTLHLKKGDSIAIMLPNILQYPIALFAAMRLGIIVINVDPLYTPRELIHQLNDARVETILFLENFGDTVAEAMPKTQLKRVISTKVGDCLNFPSSFIINSVLRYVKKAIPSFHIPKLMNFKKALKNGDKSRVVDAELNHDDILFLQYTGGTTGVAKGAILTHGNLVANMLQSRAWIGSTLTAGNDVIVAPLPIYHIFSMTANILTMMSLGCTNLLITNPKDFEGFVKILKKNKFHSITGVNTLYRKLMNVDGFNDVDFSSLKLTLSGGMSVTRDVADDWKKITGTPIIEAYGLTETSPAATINPLDLKEYNGFIGLPLPSTFIQIKDDDDNDLGIDAEGELCIKGPQVTQGYWKRPDESKKAFTKDGYFRTGDYATINAKGYVKILDRKKDMILVSGFNVFPNEIEAILMLHPDIVEAAAIAMPYPSSGEAVKVFIVKRTDSLTEETVNAYCRKQLTAYKCPKEIVFMDELPKSNVGKVLRKNLR